jgi:hypothetical protein
MRSEGKDKEKTIRIYKCQTDKRQRQKTKKETKGRTKPTTTQQEKTTQQEEKQEKTNKKVSPSIWKKRISW